MLPNVFYVLGELMFFRKAIFIFLICIVCSPFPAFSGEKNDLSDRDIFRWVAHEFGVDSVYQRPQIRRVSKQKISNLYLQNTKNMPRATSGWPAANSILGLFIAKTNVIYVRKHLSSCRQASIVAHEIAHYFQVKTLGRIGKWGGLATEIRIMRELEAREIETRFLKMFCDKNVGKQSQDGTGPTVEVTVTFVKRKTAPQQKTGS